MKKMKQYLILGIILVSALSSSIIVNAKEESDKSYIEIDAKLYKNNTVLLNEAITKALEKYDHVRITNLSDDTKILEQELNMNDDITDNVGTLSSEAVVYKATNVKTLADEPGDDYLKESGDPDVTLGLSAAETKTYALTVGATYECPKKIIFEATWGSSNSTTLTYSGEWTVPRTYNGKKVKKGILHMRPIYAVKQFDVYYRAYGTSTWIKKGRSTTKQADYVDVYKEVIYM